MIGPQNSFTNAKPGQDIKGSTEYLYPEERPVLYASSCMRELRALTRVVELSVFVSIENEEAHDILTPQRSPASQSGRWVGGREADEQDSRLVVMCLVLLKMFKTPTLWYVYHVLTDVLHSPIDPAQYQCPPFRRTLASTHPTICNTGPAVHLDDNCDIVAAPTVSLERHRDLPQRWYTCKEVVAELIEIHMLEIFLDPTLRKRGPAAQSSALSAHWEIIARELKVHNLQGQRFARHEDVLLS